MSAMLPQWPDDIIPPVNATDLQSVWNLYSSLPSGLNGDHVGMNVSLVAQHCSEGADVMALAVRAGIIRALSHLGLLSEWLVDGNPNEAVFDVMASTPMRMDFTDSDVDEILNSLRAGADGT